MPQIRTAFQQPNKVENDALLLFDLGVLVNGYASDMTRTVAVGKPDQFKKDIYNLTLEAQQVLLTLSNQV